MSSDPAEQPRALRVSQLDAQELDDGLVGMLAAKLESALSLFAPSAPSSLRPELHLALKLLIYRLGIMAHPGNRASPGMGLQNIRMVNGGNGVGGELTPTQIYLLPLLTLFPPYLLSHLHSHILSNSDTYFSHQNHDPDASVSEWRRRWRAVVRNGLEWGMWGMGGWELIGLTGFLWDGRYPTLQSRLLGTLLVPADESANVSRTISYEFMNRQLVWSGVTEALLCLLPIIRAHHHHLSLPIRRRLSHFRYLLRLVSSKNINRRRDYDALRVGLDAGDGNMEIEMNGIEGNGNGKGKGKLKRLTKRKKRGLLWKLPKETCAICYRRIHPGIDKQLGLPMIELDTSLLGENEDGEDLLAARPQMPSSTEEEQQNEDETRIHIPTKAGCEEGCFYCSYCLSKVLVEQARLVEKQEELGRYQGEDDRVGGWKCLRCGDEVWSCERVT